MDNKYGIIDLGSNTFHILLVNRKSDGQFEEVYKERIFVGLAEKGIDTIGIEAIERAKIALVHFKDILSEYSISNCRVIGTAALRSASNGQKVISIIKEEVGLEVEIIDGSREAELIYKGVKQVVDMSSGNHLIMDIGGGSVEFILVKQGNMVWAESYNVGIGVLYNYFQKSDPITKDEINNIQAFLDDKLSKLIEIVKNNQVDNLIGASGSFEVVESMNGQEISSNTATKILIEKYKVVSQKVIDASYVERTEMRGLPESRVKLIVVAMVLIDYVLDMVGPKELTISPYALKEGLLSEVH